MSSLTLGGRGELRTHSSVHVSRPARRSPTTWGLLGLVWQAGLVGTAYRAWKRTVNRRWLIRAVATMSVAALIAAETVVTTMS